MSVQNSEVYNKFFLKLYFIQSIDFPKENSIQSSILFVQYILYLLNSQIYIISIKLSNGGMANIHTIHYLMSVYLLQGVNSHMSYSIFTRPTLAVRHFSVRIAPKNASYPPPPYFTDRKYKYTIFNIFM